MKSSKRLTKRARLALRAAGALTMLSLLSVGCMSDSVDGDDEAYMPDRIDPGNGGPNGDLEPNDCDMTGSWIAQFRGRTIALGLEARPYNWFYYELEDIGDEVIIHRGWDCGFQVCNATKIALSDAQFDALGTRNRQEGVLVYNEENPNESLVVEQREATYKKLPDGTCEFSMGRWWWLRSAPPDRYPDRADYATMTIEEIKQQRPLPPKGTEATPDNDWDGNLVPGFALIIDAPAGRRDAAQRDWNEFGPGIIPDGLSDFTVPARFDNEEILYDTSSPLLDQLSTPIAVGNTVRFVKLSESAPEDTVGFREFCNAKINEYFRSEGAGDEYCAMRAQSVTELNPEPSDTDPE